MTGAQEQAIVRLRRKWADLKIASEAGGHVLVTWTVPVPTSIQRRRPVRGRITPEGRVIEQP